MNPGECFRSGRKILLPGVCVQTDIQFYDGVPVARFVNHVTNEGEEEQVLTYLSSFTCSGIKRDGNFLYIPHNGWTERAELAQIFSLKSWISGDTDEKVSGRSYQNNRSLQIPGTGPQKSICRWDF